MPALITIGVVLLAAAGCGDDDVAGYGHLDAGDLAAPTAPGHFTAAPATVTAGLVARDNGCVNVIVDGVERHPIWPDGTEVTEKTITPLVYEVRLPGDRTLLPGGVFTG
jgi:hypothetical protein